MKHFYFAVTVEENKKYYSYVVKIAASDNVLSKLKINGITAAHICPTKKNAADIVQIWNGYHKANGTYLFNNPAF